VAGTTLWYNGPSSDTGRQSYILHADNGTPGVLDCQDAHTVTAVIPALTITKQVAVVGGGLAVPGATLDYLVQVTKHLREPGKPVVITDNRTQRGAGGAHLTYWKRDHERLANGVSAAGKSSPRTTRRPTDRWHPRDDRPALPRTLGSTLAAGTISPHRRRNVEHSPADSKCSVSITVWRNRRCARSRVH